MLSYNAIVCFCGFVDLLSAQCPVVLLVQVANRPIVSCGLWGTMFWGYSNSWPSPRHSYTMPTDSLVALSTHSTSTWELL